MPTTPSIDIVIIGLNSAKTLAACLESVRQCGYPKSRMHQFYVDGGSSDQSMTIARTFGAECIRVDASEPAPGRQRNAGWHRGASEFVQFLDSDTTLDAAWLEKAVVTMLEDHAGAVCGDRRESHPEATLFNWLGDKEWNVPPGEIESFGGDVLISRVALEATGGYDDHLIAGEDPELSCRIRQSGYKILKLDEPMTRHDLAMHTCRQYCKRAYRSGHAFAEIHARHKDLWAKETRRILLRTIPFLVGVAMLPFALRVPWMHLPIAAGAIIMARPRLFLVRQFMDELSLTRKEARLYAWHASIVVLPQFFGMVRFYIGRIFGKPLTNRRILAAGTP